MNRFPPVPPEEEWRLSDTAPSPWVMMTLAKVPHGALRLPADLTGTVTWCTIYPWVITTVLTRPYSYQQEGNEGAEQQDSCG